MKNHISLMATTIFCGITSVAAAIFPHAAQAPPLDEDRCAYQTVGNAIAEFFQKTLRSYHPEKHYMRG